MFTVTCLEKNGSVGQDFFFQPKQLKCTYWLSSLCFTSRNIVFIRKKKAKITNYLWKIRISCTLSVFILLCKYFLRKCRKKVYSQGFLERVCRITVNTTFFFFRLIFSHFFCFANLSLFFFFFFYMNAIKVYRQWVLCGCNSSYSFPPIVLKHCRCFLHGMEMCIWFWCHLFMFFLYPIFRY